MNVQSCLEMIISKHVSGFLETISKLVMGFKQERLEGFLKKTGQVCISYFCPQNTQTNQPASMQILPIETMDDCFLAHN